MSAIDWTRYGDEAVTYEGRLRSVSDWTADLAPTRRRIPVYGAAIGLPWGLSAAGKASRETSELGFIAGAFVCVDDDRELARDLMQRALTGVFDPHLPYPCFGSRDSATSLTPASVTYPDRSRRP